MTDLSRNNPDSSSRMLRICRQTELRRGYNNSPGTGFELEFLVDLVRQLVDCETQLEKCKERLIFRCSGFNNNVVIRLFDPSVNDGGNFYMNNVKRAFKTVGMKLDASIAGLVVRRYDSNDDGEMTYSDVIEIFKPQSIALQKELERRTIFDDDATARGELDKHLQDYIKDLFEQLLETITTAEKINLSLIKRPNIRVEQALSVLSSRGATVVALEYFRRILEDHHLIEIKDDQRKQFLSAEGSADITNDKKHQ